MKKNGSESAELIIKNYALSLDSDPVRMARVESLVEQDKINRENSANQPQVIYQQSPQTQQVQNDYPKHCTSNKIGNYTYTDCY